MIAVSAGLSVLTAAADLVDAGLLVLVPEASDRVAGRINSIKDPVDDTFLAYPEPTWVWPPYQPVVAGWLEWLDLATFEQFEAGPGAVQSAPDQAVDHQLIPRQHGMCLIVGGPQVLIDAMLGKLPEGVLKLGTQVMGIFGEAEGLTVETDLAALPVFHTIKVLVALPPRPIFERIRFLPEPEPALTLVLSMTPAWMASQDKAVVKYDWLFWREQGLLGRVKGRVGPCVEIHDHCGADAQDALLFGFLGLQLALKAQHADVLEDALHAQLVHCFGPMAANPLWLQIEDRARNQDICSRRDLQTDPAHPEIMDDRGRKPLLYGRLHLAGAETSAISPGLIEGALNAGSQAALAVTRLRSRQR